MDKETNKPSGLSKINALLQQMGISEEARKEFCVVCESWANDEKDKLQKEFTAKLGKAKQVCVEEVEAHKASLSRGVQLYLESKAESILKASEKSAAIAESEAVKSLKQIVSLLDGVSIDGAENAQALQAESKKNAQLTAEVATLRESISKEKAKSAKISELATKSVDRQKTLEKQLIESKELLSEARGSLKEKVSTAKTISEQKVKAQKPKTKSKVVSESDVGKGKQKTAEPNSDIDVIAESMG